tara:strand:+ start:78 stop:809 length:732 start_codon:yes stop_codon:yes gene_type:complete
MAGTLTGANLILRIEDALQDSTNVRWPEAELLRYINDAQREIVNFRPEASADHSNVALVVGTEQSIPDTALRLIKVVRNMSAAGGSATGKRAVTLVDMDIIDAQDPDWHDPTVTGDAAHTTTVKHYMFDEDDSRKFYVYPGASTTSTFLEIVCSRNPTDLANTSATIYIDDIYGNAIVDYVLYRCFMKDAEFAGNAQRAGGHYQVFMASVGAGAKVQFALSPNQDPIGLPNSAVPQTPMPPGA